MTLEIACKLAFTVSVKSLNTMKSLHGYCRNVPLLPAMRSTSKMAICSFKYAWKYLCACESECIVQPLLRRGSL